MIGSRRRRHGILALSLATILWAWPAGAGDHRIGRALYQGHMNFAAGIDATQNHLPIAYSACSNCHGFLGQGGREGGVTAPALMWSTLTQRKNGEEAFASPVDIAKAVTHGKGRSGKILSGAMPRYNLSDDEASSLVDYLRIIGTSSDTPSGVTKEDVRLGTILPLSGPFGTSGQAVLSGLMQVFDAVNAKGGVHGRRITLVVQDTASGDAFTAARSLFQTPVFALVGALWGTDDTAVENLLADEQVPSIAGLVVRRRASDAGPWDSDLLPPLDVQQSALEAALHTCGASQPRLALAISATVPNANSASIVWLDDVATLLDKIRTTQAVTCVGFALVATNRISSFIPRDWQQRILLPIPAALLISSTNGKPPDIWNLLGQASARIAVEVLAAQGTTLNEKAVLEALSGLRNFPALPDAPVSYSRTRRFAWDPAIIPIPAQTPPSPHFKPNPSNPGG